MQKLRKLKDLAFEKYRFFFLIDSLDEFKGDHRELVDLIFDISSVSHIKICVASRPWIVFQDAFNGTPSLRMQDLTRHDIETFTRTMFNRHIGFCEISARDPSFAENLLHEITERGSGVFLWVSLVVRSLLEGISNGDRLSDLKARLDELPDDLESLFEKILHRIDPRYHKHSSELLLIHKAHKSPIQILQFSLADDENEPFWLSGEPAPLPAFDIFYRSTTMKKRIDSRTLGLLNVDERCLRSCVGSTKFETSPNWPKCSVEYLHRTVRDWMETEAALSLIYSRVGPDFDPYVSLCKGAVLETKYLVPFRQKAGSFEKSVSKAMKWAAAASESSRQDLFPLLDALHHNVIKTLSAHTVQFYNVPEGHNALLPLALELDMDWWVETLLSNGRSGESLVLYIISTMYRDNTRNAPPGRRCLKLLLCHGALNYDRKLLVSGVRSRILETCRQLDRADSPKESKITPWVDIAELLVQYGVDGCDLVSTLLPEIEDQLRQHAPKALKELKLLGARNNPTISSAAHKSRGHKRKADDDIRDNKRVHGTDRASRCSSV